MLPPDIKKEAIENTDNIFLETEEVSLATALYTSFSWIKTKQGIWYWMNIAEMAERWEFNEIKLARRQRDMLIDMKKWNNISIESLPLGSWKTFFVNFLKKQYPDLYNKYFKND